MKKIYKVFITYGGMTENGMQYFHDWEFFSTKKGYSEWINRVEDEGLFAYYDTASAKVYEMKADCKGRFVESRGAIDNFSFTTNKKMFV